MVSKRNFLWILLFGSLIGLNEILTGSLNIPFRSVILSSIALSLLSFARYKIPQTGSSVLIIAIAVLFKLNNLGIHHCTASVFLCGPAALLFLGAGYEIFAFLFIAGRTFKYSGYALTCGVEAVVAFSLFAVMNTYIIGSWSTARLFEYIWLKSSLTAIASGIVSISGLYLVRTYVKEPVIRLKPYVINSFLGVVILLLWLFGSLTTF
jgi:hypothetical protein